MACRTRWVAITLVGIAAVVGGQRSATAQSWREMSPAERLRALRNYERYRKAPPEKRRELQERYERWRRLPREERERLRRRLNRPAAEATRRPNGDRDSDR